VVNKTAGITKPFLRRDADGVFHAGPLKTVARYRTRSAVWQNTYGAHTDADLTRIHPAVFSERLVRDLIHTYSNTGDIVLDCFSGTGTTAAVALTEGRRYLGFEINDEYHDIAIQRLKRTAKRICK
jgi:DNA modification methylase